MSSAQQTLAAVGLRALNRLAGSELVDRFTLSQPAISRHLRDLRDAGAVTVRRDGQRRVYSLRPEPLDEIADWLARLR